jgi:hypothetical protein
MSDPRNAAHAKKVTHEKKHHAAAAAVAEAPAVQPVDPAPGPKASAGLEPSLAVLGKLKEIEFHSRATLERLAELEMTVADELKQTDIVAPLGEVSSAQNAFQTKLTALIEIYKAECDRLQSDRA